MKKLTDKIDLVALVIISVCAVWLTIGYFVLGELAAAVTMLAVQTLYVLVSLAAYRGRMPFVHVLTAIFGFVLGNMMNYKETTAYNFAFWIEGAVGTLAALAGTAAMVYNKEKLKRLPIFEGVTTFVVLALCLGSWGYFTAADKTASGRAQHTMWAVPTQFDSAECDRPGTLEELIYETKAYATDNRTVTKRALVYLPYGYDEAKQYNILYLMHGTGDDENYWLSTYSWNKTMVDNLIARGEIEPLIIVTPTFYVEDDCMDGLDALTYSFREELRGDLMPAVESKYSTYAGSADDEGFRLSRDHRAFAGLSRGAVTTYHSAFCGSLDYFSWYGTFSGSRTDREYFESTIQSEDLRDYPINYLYVTSGAFDFALPRQCQDNAGLLELEDRLTTGVNTDFDVFPMRYHSQGNWHLALYNLLQRIF